MSTTRILIGIAIAVLFQTALLGHMVWTQITLLSSPTEVVLKTIPIDPHDLFRGDYVILNYEISTFDNDKINIPDTLRQGDNVFVVLDTSETFATPVEMFPEAPISLAENQAVILGEVSWVNLYQQEICDDCTKIIGVTYQIDSYFVPEGTGTDLEKYRDERALGVIVALNDEGDSAIKGLMIDGEKIYDEPLF